MKDRSSRSDRNSSKRKIIRRRRVNEDDSGDRGDDVAMRDGLKSKGKSRIPIKRKRHQWMNRNVPWTIWEVLISISLRCLQSFWIAMVWVTLLYYNIYCRDASTETHPPQIYILMCCLFNVAKAYDGLIDRPHFLVIITFTMRLSSSIFALLIDSLLLASIVASWNRCCCPCFPPTSIINGDPLALAITRAFANSYLN